MRLIDADLLIAEICQDECERKYCDCDYTCSSIASVVNAPTVEALPIRRTKPVMGVSKDQMRTWWQCGNCESVIDQGDRYCRGCGAEVEWDGGK